jgi:hypothetical protein
VLGLRHDVAGSLIFVGLLHKIHDAVSTYSPSVSDPPPESAGAAVEVFRHRHHGS